MTREHNEMRNERTAEHNTLRAEMRASTAEMRAATAEEHADMRSDLVEAVRAEIGAVVSILSRQQDD